MNNVIFSTPPVSYCIDANYYKGTTIEQYLEKKRRQLVMEANDTQLEDMSITKRPAYRVRKLTQKECWRLMGFDDLDYERARDRMNEKLYGGKDRSGSQLYKQAGNSIVVDVLQHIMEELYKAMPYLFEDIEVGSFFSGIGAFEKALQRLNNATPDSTATIAPAQNLELEQLGYINGYNGDANRIYNGNTIARALKAEAGGGGAKTGWYRVQAESETPLGIVDPQGRVGKRCVIKEDCPTLRTQIHGNPPGVVYERRDSAD